MNHVNPGSEIMEMLSYGTTLSLLCYNINYAGRRKPVPVDELADTLKKDRFWLEKAARIFCRLGMARLVYDRGIMTVEMTEPVDINVKKAVFDVMWEKRHEYSAIYRDMMKAEAVRN